MKVLMSVLPAVSTNTQAQIIKKCIEELGYEVEFKKTITPDDVRHKDNVAFLWFTLPLCNTIGDAVFPSLYAKKPHNKAAISYVTVEGIPTKANYRNSNIPKLDFVANSQFTANHLRKAGLNVIDVVHHAVDIELCNMAVKQSGKLRKQLKKRFKNKCLILYVGSNNKRKRLDLLSQAVDIVNKKHKDEYVVLLHAERNSKGQFPQDNVIQLSIMGDKRYFEVLQLMVACDYLVHPSVCEGFGLPPLEANAVGRPAIHCWFPPLSEFSSKEFNFVFSYTEIKLVSWHGLQHWMFHEYPPEALADLMMDALDVWKNKPEEYEKYCKMAKEHARNWDRKKVYIPLLRHLRLKKVPPPTYVKQKPVHPGPLPEMSKHPELTKKKISIVIGCWNALRYIQECLAAIEKNTVYPNYEIIIVNDASTEWGLKEYLNTVPYKVIHNKKNLGYGPANNVGMRQATGEYIMFLNVDTKPHLGWLWELVKVMEQNPKVGVVGPKLLFPDGTIQHAGCYFGDVQRIGLPMPYHKFSRKPANHPLVNKMKYVQAVTGACQLFRREPLLKVGGHDPKFLSMDYEDMDVCFAVRNLGFKCVYCPTSVVTHYTSVIKKKDPKWYAAGKIKKIWRGKQVSHNVAVFMEKWADKIVVDG